MVNASETEGASGVLSALTPKWGELIGLQFVIFTTFAFLRRSMNSTAVRWGPPSAGRRMIEPFARVTEPAHQI